jgi:mono/diheme cytochrome c family protein
MRSSHISGNFVAGLSAVIALLLFALLAAPAEGAAADAAAEAIFKTSCSGCHGPEGRATSPAAKLLKLRNLLSPEVQKKSDAELFEITAKGSNNMPPFEKSLGKAKIQALISYLRKLSKKK